MKLSLVEADRLARLISGHAVDPTGTVVALTPAEIAGLWAEQHPTRYHGAPVQTFRVK